MQVIGVNPDTINSRHPLLILHFLADEINISKTTTIFILLRANNKSIAAICSNHLIETMKKPNLKQLTMPTIITFILIIASFTVASKYELKSIMKQPIKMIAPAKHQSDTLSVDDQDSLRNIQRSDTTALSTEGNSQLFQQLPELPKKVSIVLLSKFQVNLALPKGT
ncbi:MAG: hypothetical protein R8G66_16325 [Cytophagales bacterium]|nr:hypothetical protein [Cytophagales bacterium]